MIAVFFETVTDPHWKEIAQTYGWRHGWAAFRATYREFAAEERLNRDVAAISTALSCLSSRQLQLIGVRRETLFCDVEALVWQAGDARAARDEIVAILDGNQWPMALPAPERSEVESDTAARTDHRDRGRSISQAA